MNNTSKLNQYWHILVRNPALKVSIFVVGVICAFFVEFGMQKLILNYFPEYYENDAQEIIQSQNLHFNEIKKSISSLRNDMSTPQGKELVSQLDTMVSKAKRDNELLTLSLDAINKENSLLRDQLVKLKGIDAGTDIRLHDGRAIKIGNYVISANYINISNNVLMRTSSSEGNDSRRLKVGESLNFDKNDNEVCTLSFLGEPVRKVFDFSLNCKNRNI